MSNVSEFKAAIKSGIIRGHKFRVIVSFPSFAGTVLESYQASLLARSTATPSSIVGEVELKWGGRTLPIPGDREYPEWTCTFIGVQDMKVFTAFQKWSNGVNAHNDNTAVSADIDDLMSDITLQLLDTNDNIIMQWVLNDSWPREIGQLEMDMEAENSPVNFETTFRYVNYDIVGVTS